MGTVEEGGERREWGVGGGGGGEGVGGTGGGGKKRIN